MIGNNNPRSGKVFLYLVNDFLGNKGIGIQDGFQKFGCTSMEPSHLYFFTDGNQGQDGNCEKPKNNTSKTKILQRNGGVDKYTKRYRSLFEAAYKKIEKKGMQGKDNDHGREYANNENQ